MYVGYAGESTHVWEAGTGMGAWAREARRVMMLASELCIPLAEQDLLYADVYDLIALRVRYARLLARGAPHRSLWPWRRR